MIFGHALFSKKLRKPQEYAEKMRKSSNELVMIVICFYYKLNFSFKNYLIFYRKL